MLKVLQGQSRKWGRLKQNEELTPKWVDKNDCVPTYKPALVARLMSKDTFIPRFKYHIRESSFPLSL